MKKILFIILVTFVTSSCSVYSIDSQDVGKKYYPPKKTSDQIVYLKVVDQPYETIGQVVVNTERRQQMSDVLEKMKREAAILGADALTNIQTDATGVWKNLPAQEFIKNGYVRANFSATVIVFK